MENIEETVNKKQTYQKSNGEVELDLINIFSHMGKQKKLVAYLLILAILVGTAAGALYSGFEHLSGKGSYARALITFQFKGIESGVGPNGASFDVTMIKSPYVIQPALEQLGISESYADKVRKNLSISGVIPEDAVEQLTIIEKISEKDATAYEKVRDVSYFPSQYVIYLYDDGTFSPKELTQILDGVIASYEDYFIDTYANNDVLSVTSNLLDTSDYDYPEYTDLFETQVNIMRSYAAERMNDAPDFRSAQTGLSFEDIVSALDFVQSVDIARFVSYVETNALTRNRARQIEYYNYNIKEYTNKLSELQLRLDSVESTITSYEKDPVVIVSNSDSTLEYGEKNEFYDNLINQKIALNKQIAETNTRINKFYQKVNDLQNSEKIPTQADFDYADGLISKLRTVIASWVDLTEETTEEYYNTTLLSNAVKVSVEPQYYIDGGIGHIAKNVIVCAGALVLIVLIWWFAAAVKREILIMRGAEVSSQRRESDN